MAILDWLKHPRQRARIDAAYDGLRAGDRIEQERRLHDQGIAPAPSTDEARAYAFALDLLRRRGPDEASRIADLVVRNVQILSRGGV